MRLLSIAVVCLLMSCGERHYWEYEKDWNIEGISPVGIAYTYDGFWLADTDLNQLVLLDKTGKEVQRIDSLERPMHIAPLNDRVVVPEYGSDLIKTFSSDGFDEEIPTLSLPDAPAGVDVSGEYLAVADFYNHRVIFQKGNQDMTIGKKGHEASEFHYPTDVQFHGDKLFVADAYNNRIQVFDKQGNHLKTFGKEEGMNAATGLYVTDEEVVVTDFENDRLLTYSHDGTLLNIIEEGLHRPTDVTVVDNKMYVINYKGQFISIYNRG